MKISLPNFALPKLHAFLNPHRTNAQGPDTHTQVRSNPVQDRHSADDLDRSQPDPSLVENTVNQHLRNALDGTGTKFRPDAASDAQDYSPDKVAGRILGFVQQRLASVEDPAQRAAMLDQAKQGITQGFAEARDVLKNLDALHGSVADNIDQTYSKIMDGLDQLGQPASTPTTEADTPSAASLQRAAAASVAHVESGSLSLAVRTADGDTVTISFQREQGSALTAYAAQDGDSQSSGASYVGYQSSSLNFSVEGNLDEGETKAISALVKDVEHLAGRFFSGDLQAAFQEASKMGFDNQELAGFALNLTQTVEHREAAAAYQATSGDSATAPASIKDAVAATADLGKLYQKTGQSGLFADPKGALSDLFGGVSAAKGWTGQAGGDAILQQMRALLDQFAAQPTPQGADTQKPAAV